MNIYLVFWRGRKPPPQRKFGYVKAENRDAAFRVAKQYLNPSQELLSVYRSSVENITPQSLCINFPNDTDYTLF